jgi:hypothetical protein
MSDCRLTPTGKKIKTDGNIYQEYLCSCGNKKFIIAQNVRSGNTKSCGCIIKEILGKRNVEQKDIMLGSRKKVTHHVEYNAWHSMKSRCLNPSCRNYHRYGGRGIKVCEKWMYSFSDFFKDMGERPTELYSLDRVDNNGDYCPENCRWATRQEQANNTSTNVLLELDGRSMTITEWGRETGINSSTIRYRVKKLGWSTKRALTQKPRKRTSEN